MRPSSITLFSLLTFLLSFPLPAQAFWGMKIFDYPSLDLDSGYDVNTVTTVTGKILSLQSGVDRRNLQLEVEDGGVRMMVFLGPQRYWLAQGVVLKVGDKVSVRGSKAQGRDGVIYILAQEVTETSQGLAVRLRDLSGHPNWAGGRTGRGNDASGGEGSGNGSSGGNGGGSGGGSGGGGGGR